MTRARHAVEIDREKIWRLHRQQGLSASVIAQRLGCSRRGGQAESRRRR